VHFLLEIPVVQDHAHRDHIGLRQRAGEEIQRSCGDAFGKPGGRNLPFGDRGGGWKISSGATKVGVLAGDEHRQLAGRSAHVAYGVIA